MATITTLAEYQSLAARTHGANGKERDEKVIAIDALGLAGEAGEVADLIKKYIGHGHPVDREKVAKELGDVLWYCAALATDYGLTLEDIATANVRKLEARYPQGFSTAASLARVDVVTP